MGCPAYSGNNEHVHATSCLPSCRTTSQSESESQSEPARSRVLTFNLFLPLPLSLSSCVPSWQLSRCNGDGCVSRYHSPPPSPLRGCKSLVHTTYVQLCMPHVPQPSPKLNKLPKANAVRWPLERTLVRSWSGLGLGLGLGPLCVNILRHACVPCSHYKV